MARIPIPNFEVSRTAIEKPAQTVATTEMKIENNDGRVILECEAVGGATEIEVLVAGNVDGQAVAAKKYVIAEGVTKLFGPFPTTVYNQADNSVTINPTNTKGKFRSYHV